jgi:hypothetical protein
MDARVLALSFVAVVIGQQFPLLRSEMAATNSFAAFQHCVDRNVESTFNDSIKKGGELELYKYHTAAANNIIRICDPKLAPESMQDSIYTNNNWYEYVNNAVEAQAKIAMRNKAREEAQKERRRAELDAPRLKAAKAAENEASTTYFRCLVSHAQFLALNSNEPADIIAKASFPSCLQERERVFTTFRQHRDIFEPEAMEATEKQFERALLLEIIKARAVRPSATPSPTKSDEPT